MVFAGGVQGLQLKDTAVRLSCWRGRGVKRGLRVRGAPGGGARGFERSPERSSSISMPATRRWRVDVGATECPIVETLLLLDLLALLPGAVEAIVVTRKRNSWTDARAVGSRCKTVSRTGSMPPNVSVSLGDSFSHGNLMLGFDRISYT